MQTVMKTTQLPAVMFMSRSKRTHPLPATVVGLFFGFAFAAVFRTIVLNRSIPVCTISGSFQVHRLSTQKIRQIETTTNNVGSSQRYDKQQKLLFIGVMSAQKYLETRALSIYNTWGQNVSGKLMFFSSSISQSSTVPLVALKSVDDSYPPQKKSFLMMKYMYDHYLNEYEWFMRADDDVYIRTDMLEKFLRSVNSSKAHFIGQAGVGNKDEFGQLNLESDENFCMGGPGVIFSRETLRMVAPHIKYCLKHLFSTHEDVEIGRCIRKFVGIPCTWSYEMQNVFYHNFSGEVTTTGRLKTKEIHRAMTLHPVKHPSNLYRIHSYFHGLKSQDLRFRTVELQREIAEMALLCNDNALHEEALKLGSQPSLTKFIPQSSGEVIPWNFFTTSIYSSDNLNPKRRIEGYLQTAFDDIIMQVMETINKFSKQRGRVIDYKEVYYGYYRVNPMYSADYILDLLLTYKKYRGKKMTVPVRRHAYIQQTFSQIEIREKPTSSEYIHFILPLYGRLQAFQRFLLIFETICLQKQENVKMAVILFQDENRANESGEARRLFDNLRIKYPDRDLKMIEASGIFSRALALEIGAKLFPTDALLYFIDVDIIFNEKALQRVRLNTERNRSVYFPIVFSQYDPQFLSSEATQSGVDDSLYRVDQTVGYWRQFGFGIVSLYHSDLMAVGGMDTTIKGWGKEDVDLYTKVALSNLTVFRAPDPDLVHVFHLIECEPSLEAIQFEMCLGSKLSSMGPFENIANLILNNYDKYLPEQK